MFEFDKNIGCKYLCLIELIKTIRSHLHNLCVLLINMVFNYCIIEFDKVLFLGTCTPNIPNCCLSSNQEIHPKSKGRV